MESANSVSIAKLSSAITELPAMMAKGTTSTRSKSLSAIGLTRSSRKAVKFASE
jgi:hypothetical protein